MSVSPKFCYMSGQVTHQSRFCETASVVNSEFRAKYAEYGEWICSDMNMRVTKNVCDAGLKKKDDGGFVLEWEVILARIRGNLNL